MPMECAECAECGHLHFEGARLGYSECPVEGCGCEGQAWARPVRAAALTFLPVARAAQEFSAAVAALCARVEDPPA